MIDRETAMELIWGEAVMEDAVSKLEGRVRIIGDAPVESDILLRTCKAVRDIFGVLIEMNKQAYKMVQEGDKEDGQGN